MSPQSSVLMIIEPFYGGSHKQLTDLLISECHKIGHSVELHTLPAKKWHWRARTSALYFAQNIPIIDTNSSRILLVSSVLNLAELIALRSDIAKMRKIIYFHENQLIYPVQNTQDRDFQYGYNQVLSCLVADDVIFNSNYNRESFLNSIDSFFKLMPDHRPKGLKILLEPRCKILYFPLDFSQMKSNIKSPSPESTSPLHIVWPHRWEHDKQPELFFKTLFSLKELNCEFVVSVLGENFSEIPDIFEEAKIKLSNNIANWGFLPTKSDYYDVLAQADVVLSTAKHEFFGVAMLEAVHFGCYPLCPNSLVYPEIFTDEYLYNTPNQLLKRLKQFCHKPSIPRKHNIKVDLSKFDWKTLKSSYNTMLNIVEK